MLSLSLFSFSLFADRANLPAASLSSKMNTIRLYSIGNCGEVPTRGSTNAAGWDMYAASLCVLQPGKTTMIPTKLVMALPPRIFGKIESRSGHALEVSELINGFTWIYATVCMSVCLSDCLSDCLFVCLSVCLSVRLCLCLFV